MSSFFNSFGNLLVYIASLMKSCTNGANKSECSVNILTGMLPKGEGLVGSKLTQYLLQGNLLERKFSLAFTLCFISCILGWRL